MSKKKRDKRRVRTRRRRAPPPTVPAEKAQPVPLPIIAEPEIYGEIVSEKERELGGLGVWVYQTELDDKVCDACRALHGKIYTTREIAEQFDWAEKAGPALIKPNVHPNCRCRCELLVEVKVTGIGEGEQVEALQVLA